MVNASKTGIVDLLHFGAVSHSATRFKGKVKTLAADDARNFIAAAVSMHIPAVFRLSQMEPAKLRIPISTHIYESLAVLGINPRSFRYLDDPEPLPCALRWRTFFPCTIYRKNFILESQK